MERARSSKDAAPVESRSTKGDPAEAPRAAVGSADRVVLRVVGFGGVGLVLAAGIALVLLRRPAPEDEPAAASEIAPLASLEALVRSGRGDAARGLVAVGPDGVAAPLGVGAGVAAGERVRTDERTRARLRLRDGSALSLEQATEVALEAPRTVHLERGAVYAEIAPLEAGPRARFVTPGGVVEVLGAKLLLTATDAQTSARVVQGVVSLEGGWGRAEVKAGEEALLAPGQAPVVMPAVGLAASVSWTELDVDEAEGVDSALPGLGELRARRPGERGDRERPLRLASHRVKVRIVGNVARTEIEEAFENDGPDRLEGIYRFPLPSDARIASLSLEVDGRWEEGAFVARDRARRIWRGVLRNATPVVERDVKEEFIWVPGPWRDPALLEWQQGGRFELRIFPIPARGARRVRIAYEQTIAPHGGGRRYVYPLPHAASSGLEIGRFEADVRVAEADSVRASGYALEAQPGDDAHRLTFATDDFEPSGAMLIDYAAAGDESPLRAWSFDGAATAAPPDATRERDPAALEEHRRLHADGRGYVAFALRPELPAWSASRPRDYVVVVDSSQSMVGERYERAVRLVTTMIGEMDPRDRALVMACDATCRAMESFEAPHAASASRAAEFLLEARPAGASNIAAAIREAVDHGERLAGAERAVHVVYVGDGFASTGPRRAASIAAEVREARRGASITTVGIGQEADSVVLATMAREGGGHYVPYVPGERVREAALAVLETTYGVSVEGLRLELPEGITDVVPSALPNLRAGEELWFAGRVSGPVRGELRVEGRVGGEPWVARYPVDVSPTKAAAHAFVPRIWASGAIADLELGGRGEDAAKIVALSKGFHVMSRQTSLLVLESEAMFRAFGVDRARPAIEWTGEEGANGEDANEPEAASAARASGAGPRAELRRRSSPARRGRAPSASAPMADSASPLPGLFGPAPRPRERVLPAEPIALPPPSRGRLMRRVPFLEGHIDRSGPRASDREKLAAADAAARENPDSRDRLRELVRALSRAGELAKALDAAERWIARDALDPEALTYLSDALGRLGRRDEALRVLTGVVDLDRDAEVLHRRLASAFARAGDSGRACDHRVALAEIDSSDAGAVADAVRCERRRGRGEAAERLVRGVVEPRTRARIEELAARPESEERVRGDLLLEASWSGGEDLDLTIVTPQGTRLSWMGGRRNVVGSDAAALGVERLGLRRAGAGDYLLEVNRTRAGAGAPLRGQVRVRTGTETKVIPFELMGASAVIGRVHVVRRFRLVPS